MGYIAKDWNNCAGNVVIARQTDRRVTGCRWRSTVHSLFKLLALQGFNENFCTNLNHSLVIQLEN